MLKAKLLGCGALGMLLINPANQYTRIGANSYTIIGAGVISCGTWISDRYPMSYGGQIDGQWVLGYLSGISAASFEDDPLNNMDAKGVLAWIDNYCRANPIVNVDKAAIAFYHAHPK